MEFNENMQLDQPQGNWMILFQTSNEKENVMFNFVFHLANNNMENFYQKQHHNDMARSNEKSGDVVNTDESANNVRKSFQYIV